MTPFNIDFLTLNAIFPTSAIAFCPQYLLFHAVGPLSNSESQHNMLNSSELHLDIDNASPKFRDSSRSPFPPLFCFHNIPYNPFTLQDILVSSRLLIIDYSTPDRTFPSTRLTSLVVLSQYIIAIFHRQFVHYCKGQVLWIAITIITPLIITS